jgi:hypothetical protein
MGAKDVVCFKQLRGSALTLRGAGRLTTESFRLWFGCLATSANEEARMENAIGVDPSDAAEERHQTRPPGGRRRQVVDSLVSKFERIFLFSHVLLSRFVNSMVNSVGPTLNWVGAARAWYYVVFICIEDFTLFQEIFYYIFQLSQSNSGRWIYRLVWLPS